MDGSPYPPVQGPTKHRAVLGDLHLDGYCDAIISHLKNPDYCLSDSEEPQETFMDRS